MDSRIASTVRGPADAPTLVLLHGVVHRGHAWDPVVEQLARRWRVVTLDLPGHGDSGPIAPSPDLVAPLVDDVAAEISRLCPDSRPHLVGNSLGGYVALEIGNRGGADGVTAFSPAGFFRNRAELAYTMLVFRSLQAGAKPLARWAGPLSRSAVGRSLLMGIFTTRPWRYPAANLEIDALALADDVMLSEVDELTFPFTAAVDRNLPVTVAWGRADLVLPAGQRKQVRRWFPQAEIILMPHVGHVPMSDDPERVVRIIERAAFAALARERRIQ